MCIQPTRLQKKRLFLWVFLCIHFCVAIYGQSTGAILFCAAHSCVWSRGAAPPGSPVWHKAAASGSPGLLSPPSGAYGPTSWLQGRMRVRESERGELLVHVGLQQCMCCVWKKHTFTCKGENNNGHVTYWRWVTSHKLWEPWKPWVIYTITVREKTC